MDALVTAGGVPAPDDPLYEYSQGESKALIDIGGKPMIQWVLDAISGSSQVDHVVIIGIDESSGVTCNKPTRFVPSHGNMINNIRVGVEEVVKLNLQTKYILVVSSDIPAITAEMVDWVVDTAMETQDDMYYSVVEREVMEKRFPGSKRTYTKLKGIHLSGGDMNVVSKDTVMSKQGLWNRMEAARKNPFKQAALVGFDTLFLILFRLVDLEGVVKNASKRLKMSLRAIVSPYAEIAMDVDNPHQLEILRADLIK
jgi:GTP:adenosylcobinamide-phosphate guanylyltransferase